ncbi:MAG: dockerin type I domain-containing protein [Chthoniobacterales bacterium]
MKNVRFLLVASLFSALPLFASASAPTVGPGVITGLSDPAAPRSGYLEILGSNFGTDGVVAIDGLAAPVADWQDSKIVAYVPETARVGPDTVQVTNTSGQPSNVVNLGVTLRQANGRVNWRFRQNGPYSQVRPVIGPDGTIYTVDVFFHLYALTPDGALKWVVRGAGNKGVAVGADGGIYVGSEDSVKAFTPDGSLRWTYVLNPRALFFVGLSVGPDGNLYAVATEGPGTLSLTPQGTLRWAHPETYDNRPPVDYGEIVFGPNGSTSQLYFYANNHLRAYRLDGTLVFTIDGQFGQPAVAGNGSIHGPFSAYSPANGSVLWTFQSNFPYNVSSPPTIGADGSHYFLQNTIRLFALNPNGSERWLSTLDGTFGGAIVDPANSQLILGSRTTLDNAGYIISASTTDGHESWRVTLPLEDPTVWNPALGMYGFNQSTDTRARFRPDGSAAYMITFTATGDNNTSKSFVYSLNTALAPLPAGVVSRKTHGSAGTFDIPLPLTGTPGIEPRTGATARDHQVVVAFPSSVTVGGFSVQSADGSATGAATVSNQTVTINLHNVSDRQTITIRLISVSDGATTGDLAIPMSLLLGDANGDGLVNASDALQTRNRSGAAVGSSTFRSDVNADGVINTGDALIVRNNSGGSLP